MSESGGYIRQILPSKVDPRTVIGLNNHSNMLIIVVMYVTTNNTVHTYITVNV